MLPPVSLPIAKPTNPAAVAAPGPALDPDDPSSSSHGFMVWPPNQMSFSASAPILSLATRTAPASCKRSRKRPNSACARTQNQRLAGVSKCHSGLAKEFFRTLLVEKQPHGAALPNTLRRQECAGSRNDVPQRESVMSSRRSQNPTLPTRITEEKLDDFFAALAAELMLSRRLNS
jgi:hypothetical protein